MIARPMELVRQPEDSQLCLACCCAMLAQTSLESVLKETILIEGQDENNKPIKYLSMGSAVRYLLDKGLWLGGEIKLRYIDHWNGTIELDLMKAPALVTIPSLRYNGCMHAIVYDHISEKYFDPQEAAPLERIDFSGEVLWSIVSRI